MLDPAVEASVMGPEERIIIEPTQAQPTPEPPSRSVSIECVIVATNYEREMIYAGRVQAPTGRSKATMEVVERMSGMRIENLPVPMALLGGRLNRHNARVRVTVEMLPPDEPKVG